jgi:hypothetical protein
MQIEAICQLDLHHNDLCQNGIFDGEGLELPLERPRSAKPGS